MSRVRWERWQSKYTTDAGDDIVLEYSDKITPSTHWDPAEYEIEYHKLTVNGERIYDIESFLEKTLSDNEMAELFGSAQSDPDY